MDTVSGRGRVRVEHRHKGVRAHLGGDLVADTIRPLLVWEVPFYRAHHLPLSDVRATLVATGGTEHSPSRGDAELFDVKVAEATASAGFCHVEVVLNGESGADSHHPSILHETGLPPRSYLPLPHACMDVPRPSASSSHYPNEGTAGYWLVEVGWQRHDDLAWIYRTSLPESQKIAGLACFYNEKMQLIIDGEAQEQPHTHFS